MTSKADSSRHLIRNLAGSLSVILGLTWMGDAAAQTVEFQHGTRGDARADEVLRRVLARGRYRVLARDTILTSGELIASDVIILGATLRVEGRIEGDLIGVQSDIFARPGGRIEGTVVVFAGGFYGSSLAELGAPPIDASRYNYRVEEREAGVYLVTAPGSGAALRLPGLYGFLLPEYDRVNALTLAWGLDLERGPSAWMPDVQGRIRYRSVREDFDGDLELSWPIGRHAVAVRGGREVRTNDGWINGSLENSLYAIIAAVDTRNYYDARFIEADLQVGFGTRVLWTHDLVVGWERARGLENQDPFSIFEVRGGFQQNTPVSEAEIASAKLVSAGRVRDQSLFPIDLELSLEHADADIAGDISFTLLGGVIVAEVPAWGRHTLVVEGRGQIPSSSGAPAQRWRALGGWGTLPTLRPVEREGDNMWLVAATYRAPLGRRVGARWELVPWLQWAAGNAWPEGVERPSTVHNLALGLALGPLAAAVYTAPSDDFKTVLAVGFERIR
ncbi:MAG: hypothetical protein JSV86_20400 [Gemmatimonadota bacterium]|nr:MAG: hypothetical protein JSV86_20400 [Gemmatimonadota bacterium]